MRAFSRSENGNVAVLFGLALPVFLGIGALAVDGASINRKADWLQNTSDSVSLAVAKELHLFRDKPDTLVAAGKDRMEVLLAAAGHGGSPHSVNVDVDLEGGTVTVSASLLVESFLPVAVGAENPVTVSSTARSYGSARLCVLGLNQTGSPTIKVDKGALLDAPECAIQSNSTDEKSLEVKGGARIESAGTCVSGGVSGRDAITPAPEVDCPILDDPLSDRVPPTVAGCDYLDFRSEKGISNISPGTYCGGIKLEKDAVVFAEPGIYVITGGKLDTGSKTELRGENVSFYFADDAATFDFKDEGLVELSAPETGPMAGILFYVNSKATKHRHYKISSDSARKLLGTIYLPYSVLSIEGGGKVAEASAYTVIVADQIEIKESTLVVNANYASTDVPVPEGLGPNATMVTLER